MHGNILPAVTLLSHTFWEQPENGTPVRKPFPRACEISEHGICSLQPQGQPLWLGAGREGQWQLAQLDLVSKSSCSPSSVCHPKTHQSSPTRRSHLSTHPGEQKHGEVFSLQHHLVQLKLFLVPTSALLFSTFISP